MKPFLVSLLLVVCFSSQNIFGGECVKGDCVNGWGTYSYPDSSKYVGRFINDKKHGYGTGTMTYKNGSKFVGHWKDDKPHGIVTMTYPALNLPVSLRTVSLLENNRKMIHRHHN